MMINFLFKRNRCLICGEKDTHLCSRCKNDILNISINKKYGNDTYLYYYSGTLRRKFLAFKFYGRKYYAKALSEVFLDKIDVTNYDIVTFVPISFIRLCERGYNQCEEILKHGNIQTTVVLKKKHSKRQARLNAEQRVKNVKNKFVVKSDISGKNILLFDDIYTTGATINEVKRTLKLQGAKRVDTIIFLKS